MRECTSWHMEDGDAEVHTPCRCPVCMGFLPSDIPEDEFTCKKCGATLISYPDVDEDTKEELEQGKICVIGKPNLKVKEISREERRINRLVKKGAKDWKGWL